MRSWWLGPIALALGVAAHADPFVKQEDADYLPPPPPPIPSPISDHLALTAGFFWGQISTFGRFDSAAGVRGTPFTAERDLGLTDKAQQPFIEIMFRLGERNRLRVNFIDLRRSGDRDLDRTVQYGDITFLVDNPVHSEFDWRQMDITYTYSFVRTDRLELGAGLGVHLVEAEARAEIPSTPQYADFNGAGPLATLAFDGTWRISRQWSLDARANYLKLTIGTIGGVLGQYHADFQYRWKRNLAFGLGYDRQQIQLTVTNYDPSGVLKFNVNRPKLFVRASF
jgi:hypothetical protein